MSERQATYATRTQAPGRCPRCAGLLTPGDEHDERNCFICGERLYTTPPLKKQAPNLTADLVERIRDRWQMRPARPITVVQLAGALTVLLGTEISESAVRHVIKRRTWNDAGVWLAMLPLAGDQLAGLLDAIPI